MTDTTWDDDMPEDDGPLVSLTIAVPERTVARLGPVLGAFNVADLLAGEMADHLGLTEGMIQWGLLLTVIADALDEGIIELQPDTPEEASP